MELVDKFGISFDDTYELGTDDNDDEIVYHKNTAPIPEGFIATSTCVVRGNEVPLYTFQQFQPIDQATQEIFDEHSLPRLGGASGDVGWSSISTFQKCPYLWQRQYMNPLGRQRIETPAFAFGGLMHTMLALHYTGAGITPEEMRDALLAKNVDAEIVGDVWRIFEAYRLYYGGTKDPLRALVVEHLAVDQATGESCRYDMIAKITKGKGHNWTPGTYIVENKTAGRFDDAALTGWANNGEILGQVMLYHRLGLARVFGELQGVIVNIIGKQAKLPLFHRALFQPNDWQVAKHAKDIRRSEALKQVYVAAGEEFPRHRASCLSQYGKCSQWDHCITGEG